MKLRNGLLVVSVCLLAVGQSAALTLGRVRGAAVVGQPLDVVVQIQLNADEAASALCPEADVFHADTRQDPARVRVTLEPTSQANTVNARVISSSFIDEPMVTVYLRAGCNQKSSRRYVLLADFPSETALPVVTTAVPLSNTVQPGTAAMAATATNPTGNESAIGTASGAQARAPDAPPLRPSPSTTGTTTASATAPKARPAARPRPPKAAPRGAPDVKVAAAAAAVAVPAATQTTEKVPEKASAPKQASSAAPVQSRLTLDPLVVLAERVTSLESSTGTTATEGVRDTARDAQRIQSLEDSVKTLVALAAKNEASLQDMRVRVQAAQAERVPVQWLYGLIALVLACMAAMAYMWSRLNASVMSGNAKDDWWRGARSAPAAVEVSVGAMPQVAVPEVQPSAPGKLVSKPASLQATGAASTYSSLMGLEDAPSSELDVSLVEMTESNFDQLMKSGKSHSAIRPGPLSPQLEPMPATTKMQALAARPINSEQLFDVRQQAEFFVSLGQTDQAVQILEKQINDHGETSPLIYLDLLQIFHSLNLKTDFRQFREDFNLLFNARVPEFAAFKKEGKCLEQYPHVLAHITALWSTRKALMVIEASIFRDSLDDRSTPFDLAAFRDLLLLHAIAQSFTIREEPTSDLTPLRANMSPISKGARLSAMAGTGAPASNSGAARLDVERSVDLVLPPSSGFSEVDISLDSSGLELRPTPNLPSVTGVLNAPTKLDPIAIKSVSGPNELDIDLDLDLSDLVSLSPTHSSSRSPAQSAGDNEVSDFSKLLKAQAPAAQGTQGAKSKAAAAESGNSGQQSESEYLADNLLDFDLSSENAKLAIAKPKGNKSKPK